MIPFKMAASPSPLPGLRPPSLPPTLPPWLPVKRPQRGGNGFTHRSPRHLQQTNNTYHKVDYITNTKLLLKLIMARSSFIRFPCDLYFKKVSKVNLFPRIFLHQLIHKPFGPLLCFMGPVSVEWTFRACLNWATIMQIY